MMPCVFQYLLIFTYVSLFVPNFFWELDRVLLSSRGGKGRGRRRKGIGDRSAGEKEQGRKGTGKREV